MEQRSRSLAEIWDSLIRAIKSMQREADKELEGMGLSLLEFKVIMFLIQNGPQPMVKVASELVVTKAAMTGLVDRLERRQLIRRERSAEDRRVIRLVPTDQASLVYDKGRERLRELVERRLSSLSREELDTLERIIEKIERDYRVEQ